MDSFLETLVAKITAANELYQSDNSAVHMNFQNYFSNKVPENCKIYHKTYNETKGKKISERDLKRPWNRLSSNYKILVILDFLKEFEKRNPGVNLNFIRYDTLLNIDDNKGLDLKMDYDYQQGKLKRMWGYRIVDDRVVKSNDPIDYISNRIKLKLRYKGIAPNASD